MRKYDLDKLTEFNNALVYAFQPELLQNGTGNDPNTVEYNITGINQHIDVLNAYMYAQETILPYLKTHTLANITANTLIEWLNQLHLRIAETLAKDANHDAGVCTQRQLFRWHHGAMSGQILKVYFSNAVSLEEVLTAAKEQKMDLIAVKDLISLLHRIQESNIDIPWNQQRFLTEEDPYYQGVITIFKLATVFHLGQLSETERALVSQFVKICAPPRQLPRISKKFAVDTLRAWRQCDPNNIDAVTQLTANVFYAITEGHWYFNGNGRVATCFVNIILRSMHRPSILMRTPDERDDPNSSYSRAIKNIDNRVELINHIKSRILDAEKNGGYHNLKLAEINQLRAKLTIITMRLKIDFPEFNINDYFVEITNNYTFLHHKNLDDTIIATLKLQLESFKTKYDSLAGRQTKRTMVPEPIQKNYTMQERIKIVEALEKLTALEGWVMYQSMAVIEIESSKIAKLVEDLNKTGAGDAVITNNSSVRLNNIRPQLLLAAIKQSEAPKITSHFSLK
jgi:hypothetical protein